MIQRISYIISLKFAPGLKKEFLLLGDNIRRYGVDVTYLIANGYSKLDCKVDSEEYLTSSQNLREIIIESIGPLRKKLLNILTHNPPKFICFYNPHLLNPQIGRFVKRELPGAVTALYLHDPHKPDLRNYGLRKSIFIRLVLHLQSQTIKHMDHIIVPSEYSLQLFKMRYPHYKGDTHIAPLMIPDQYKGGNSDRKYFSIVGNAHNATGHDTFMELVEDAAEKNLESKFALISSSSIIPILLSQLKNGAKNNLKVINKDIIADEEINSVARDSYVIFRLDREVTQSGVVPVSFMNATPIIARDIPGLTQHVKHKENGYIVPFDCTPENIIDALKYVKENFTILSQNARKSYEDIWHEKNWERYYNWLIKILQDKCTN